MGIYQEIYNLITTYIYGGAIVAGSYEELIAILVSTMACLFMIALPFVLVWKIIGFISGGRI